MTAISRDQSGLWYDESARTLAEVTAELFDILADEGEEFSTEDHELRAAIVPDEHTGIYHAEGIDPSILDEFYQDLAALMTELGPEGFTFGYSNEGGGWGFWRIQFDEGPYALANRTDTMPDSTTSPGAKWLLDVQSSLNEALDYDPNPAHPGDLAHEIADGAVPIYTSERWEVFNDLGAFAHDDEGLAGPDDDMTTRAGVILYVIASRLCAELMREGGYDV